MICISARSHCVFSVLYPPATWYSELEISCFFKKVCEVVGCAGAGEVLRCDLSLQCFALSMAGAGGETCSFISKGDIPGVSDVRDAARSFLQTCGLAWALRRESSTGMWCWRPVLSCVAGTLDLQSRGDILLEAREDPDAGGGNPVLQAQSPSDEADVTLIFASQPLFPSGWFCRLLSVLLTLSSLTMMCLKDSLHVPYAWLHWISWICGFISVHWVWKLFWPLFKYSSFWCCFLHFSSLFRDSSCP